MKIFKIGRCGPLHVLLFTIIVSGIERYNNTRQTKFKRIMGGVEAKYGYSPWLVLIIAERPVNYFWGISWGTQKSHCGASLIHKQWILTAAHCTVKDNVLVHPHQWQAKLGDVTMEGSFTSYFKGLLSEYLYKPEWADYYAKVKGVFLFPTYSPRSYFRHDIALMKLAQPVNLELPLDHKNIMVDIAEFIVNVNQKPNLTRIGVIDLMPYYLHVIRDDVVCTLKGWGCRSFDGSEKADVAHEINITLMTNKKCIQYWGRIVDTRICAGSKIANEGACYGDSGSPLTCYFQKRHLQIGIVSFRSSVNKNVPVVFTRVSPYRKWIRHTIRGN